MCVHSHDMVEHMAYMCTAVGLHVYGSRFACVQACHFLLYRFLGSCLNSRTNCYTLEVSFFSYATGGNQVQEPYNEQACILMMTVLPIGYSVIVALTGLPIGYSVIVALTGLPIRYSIIVALTGLHIGYSVIVALTGLPMGYSIIVALTDLPMGYSVIVALTGLPIGYSV